jgi:hypothetical protein
VGIRTRRRRGGGERISPYGIGVGGGSQTERAAGDDEREDAGLDGERTERHDQDDRRDA